MRGECARNVKAGYEASSFQRMSTIVYTYRKYHRIAEKKMSTRTSLFRSWYIQWLTLLQLGSVSSEWAHKPRTQWLPSPQLNSAAIVRLLAGRA
jgi:hypothetical protein